MTHLHADTGSDGFRPDIEGLRGIAVLLVVLFHAGLPVFGGYVGVDVFFVISGFLITGLLLRERERTGRIGFARFYARRVRRLLPAAAVVLVASLPAAFFLTVPLDRAGVALDAAAAALSAGNIRFAAVTGGYFSTVTSPSPFLHFWSLGIEEQFYLLWPALLALATLRAVRVRRAAAVALGGAFAVSLVACLVVTHVATSWAFYSLPTRAWELATGGLLAAGAPALARLPDRPVALAGWLALGGLAASALLLDSSIAYPGAYALAPVACSAALVLAGSRARSPRALLSTAPVRFLGRISYSLYLWHWPILVLGVLAAPALGLAGAQEAVRPGVQAAADPGGAAGALPLGVRLALMAAAVVVATASWRFVEEPFRHGLPRLALQPRRVVAAGIGAMLVVAAAGSGFAAANEAGIQPWAAPVSAASPFALPANVRPSLADARNDEERLWTDGCLAAESATIPNPDCVYGDRGSSFTVALVGDSHASALFPAVEAVALSHHWRLVPMVKASCQFLDMRLYDINLKREYTECATWNTNVVTRLNALRPGLVLVSGTRWVYTLNQADDTVAALSDALTRMVERIRGAGHVVIIGDPPIPDRDEPSCLSAHVDDIRACAIPRTRDDTGMVAPERAAAAIAGDGFIDLTDAVCPGTGPCPAVLNGMIVFRDSHHLTATFSRSLAPVLDAGIARATR